MRLRELSSSGKFSEIEPLYNSEEWKQQLLAEISTKFLDEFGYDNMSADAIWPHAVVTRLRKRDAILRQLCEVICGIAIVTS